MYQTFPILFHDWRNSDPENCPTGPLKGLRVLDIASRTLDEILTAFAKAKGTIAPVYVVDQIFEDPQYKAREAIITIPDKDFGTVRVQGVVPKFMQTPGHVRWAAKSLGADNSAFYENLLGLSASEPADFKRRGVI